MALLLTSCGIFRPPDAMDERRLQTAVELIAEVKEFGKELGIEPSDALSKSAGEQSPLSMLWLWLQRVGTVALRGPIDIRMAIGFAAVKEQAQLEQVYRVDGYSVYYRQGNEFSDPRSAATASFAAEDIVRRVKVILHEDLHSDKNFELPWEIEESIVTPLSALAAVEFFKFKRDGENTRRALDALEEERKASRELSALAAEAEKVFTTEPPEQAKYKVLALLPDFPVYHRQFQRQIKGQNSATVLEAKLSHDLAYFRHFDAIASLAANAPTLKTLIQDLKKLPPDTTLERLEKHLRHLQKTYRGSITKEFKSNLTIVLIKLKRQALPTATNVSVPH